MKWFAVRTFVRTKPAGRAKTKNSGFRSGIASVEERVVLFRARNGKAALKHGRAEAQKYVRSTNYTNVFGQHVVSSVLPYAEAYELFESPDEGVEVFSSTEIVASTERIAKILRRKIGEPAGPTTARMFISSQITDQLNARLRKW